MIDTGTMPSGRFESAHWQSGIERRSTATPGSILVEIHSSRMDASQEEIEDGESIFIVFTYYCSLLRNCAAKLRRILLMTYILSVFRPMIYVYLWIILEVSMIFILAFSSFFAVIRFLGKVITKNESQSCWFSFFHVCDLKIVSLVSFLGEIEPTNRFSPARRLSVVELSLASTRCGWHFHACSRQPC